VMSFHTRLIAIKRLRRGEPVGYGGTWICPEDMDVGVAAVGYGDGYPRHAPSGTPVLINGRAAALVGRVSMDMITLDLRRHPAGTDRRSGGAVGRGFAGGADCPGRRHDFLHPAVWRHGAGAREVLGLADG
jgi:alanine racemase